MLGCVVHTGNCCTAPCVTCYLLCTRTKQTQPSPRSCSVCKTAWYCSTACQHADWRDGHKQACPVFAQERQQRREARRGQQAAQQAGRA